MRVAAYKIAAVCLIPALLAFAAEVDGESKSCPQDSADAPRNFESDMKEAKSCARNSSESCNTFRMDVPTWYAAQAARFHDCESPSSGDNFMQMGVELCEASAINLADKGECRFILDEALNTF